VGLFLRPGRVAGGRQVGGRASWCGSACFRRVHYFARWSAAGRFRAGRPDVNVRFRPKADTRAATHGQGAMKLWWLAMSLAVCSLVVACGDGELDATGQASVAATVPPPPPPPDVGQIGQFLACSAKPRRELSARERCEVEAFRSRCTALDDCYVSCINSPDGVRGGGRCAHVCTFGPHGVNRIQSDWLDAVR